MIQLKHPEFTRILPIGIGREIFKGDMMRYGGVNGDEREFG